jgi:tRNA pseudouridine55 synthase
VSTSGILNVNKPPGPTSFDVVRLVRRGSRVKRAGHAGTLDPLAGGVLLILLGQAARITEYLMDQPKVYRAAARLGASTTTYDSQGEIVREGDYRGITEDAVRTALASFVGEIMQRPPDYSAVKVGGRRAYELARKGQDAPLRPRRALVYGISLLRFQPPELEFEVECGRGMYVRSLAHDLGDQLGCGAHLSGLVRTRVGPFTLADSVNLEDLKAAFQSGAWLDYLLPLDCGLVHLPSITLHIEDEKDLRHGQALDIDEDQTAQLPPLEDGLECRAYAEDGSLAGIVRWDAEGRLWRPVRVFAVAGQ